MYDQKTIGDFPLPVRTTKTLVHTSDPFDSIETLNCDK